MLVVADRDESREDIQIISRPGTRTGNIPSSGSQRRPGGDRRVQFADKIRHIAVSRVRTRQRDTWLVLLTLSSDREVMAWVG